MLRSTLRSRPSICAGPLARARAPLARARVPSLTKARAQSNNTAAVETEHFELPLAGATRNPNLEVQDPNVARRVLAPIIAVRGHDPSFEGARGDWWWTGAKPEECAGWQAESQVLTSLPLPNHATCTRQDVLDYFDNTWTLTELLFSSLQSDATFYLQPYHQLRQPLIFYYGHPAALYVNKFRLAGLIPRPINALYEQLFETGVDEMSWDDLSQSTTMWPTVDETHAYRQDAYLMVRSLIENHPDLADGHAPIGQDHPLWALFMGFEHERIHLETSSVLMRELPASLVRQPAGWTREHPSVPEIENFKPIEGVDYPRNQLLKVAAAEVALGKPREWPSYGWDNEYGNSKRNVRSFEASKLMVSNGEFYQFVKAGGYAEQKYWTTDGWRWRHFRNAKWPTFWSKIGPANLHQYRLRTIFNVVPMPWSWPAEVNAHEARAFCSWKAEQDGEGASYRLPTEGEHIRLRSPSAPLSYAEPADDPVMNMSGAQFAESGSFNLNLAYSSPAPVDAGLGDHAASPFGDTMGNVWEWCEDDFHPLYDFKVHTLYDDFSTPCFDGEHNMIMGGSFMATGAEASVFSRFHFRPHFFQHAGFRLIATDGPAISDAVRLDGHGSYGAEPEGYESKRLLDEFMMLHYGASEDFGRAAALSDSTGFAQRVAQLTSSWMAKLDLKSGRAIDVGCAVGGSSFELARTFEQVVGVDLSAAFVGTAQKMAESGSTTYFRRDEGDLGEERTATVPPELRSRVQFRRADACCLPPEYNGFDAVLLSNLLCRLPSPRALLGRVGGPRGLVRPGGLLVVASPYTWTVEHTPREVWLGGVERDGQPITSSETLRSILAEEFELLHEDDMPFLYREHARKFSYVVSHAMVFQRRVEDADSA